MGTRSPEHVFLNVCTRFQDSPCIFGQILTIFTIFIPLFTIFNPFQTSYSPFQLSQPFTVIFNCYTLSYLPYFQVSTIFSHLLLVLLKTEIGANARKWLKPSKNKLKKVRKWVKIVEKCVIIY